MPITYSRISNGDALDASSLNTAFSSVESSLNALTKADVAPESLGRDHLPSLVVDTKTASITPGAPFYDEYTRANAAYPGFSASAGSWTVIDDAGGGGGGTDLEVTFTSAIDPTDSKYGGILVLMNVEVQSVFDSTGSSPEEQRDFYPITAIQVYAGSSWYQIKRSVRYTRGQRFPGMNVGSPAIEIQRLFLDILTRILVTASDVSNNSITKVRGVVAIAKDSATGTTTAAQKLRLRRCRLPTIALQGSLS